MEPDTGGRVVDLVSEIKKKELRAKREWTVTAKLLDRIAADLWPGINGPAPDVSPIKGKAPRRPALSYEARRAIGEIGGKLGLVNAPSSLLIGPERASGSR